MYILGKMEQNTSLVKIRIFGMLADIVQGNELQLHDVTNTKELKTVLNNVYPQLKSIKYVIAVDKCIINSITAINKETEVALLPPFSGG